MFVVCKDPVRRNSSDFRTDLCFATKVLSKFSSDRGRFRLRKIFQRDVWISSYYERIKSPFYTTVGKRVIVASDESV